MASKPLSVAEARSLYKETTLNGQKYSYILSEPKDRKLLNTIFLIHGFPDISYGWRNQIPFLTSLGLRVVVPDMLGYGGSSTSSDPKFMTYKRAADDIAALAKELGLSRIILGGHDWGGATVYRVALFYPELVSAVFSVCTPFGAPGPKYKDMAEMPNFKYQIQFRGEELVEKIVGVEKIRQCLNAMYGGRTKDKELGFAVEHGVYLDMISECGHTPLMSKEDLDFYVERFSRNGMQGPTNWYRTGELNYEDEKAANIDWSTFKFKMPFLFIGGTRDDALPPSMSSGMDKYFRSLTRGEVNASHWALWEKPEEVNQYIKEFLFGTAGESKL